MFIEIGIIQRVSLFLGHPVYGLAIGLFSIILSTGIGSLISELLRLDTAAKLVAWSVSLCALVILLSLWFPAVVGAFEGHSLLVRVVVSLAAIVPSGLLMGFGFPTGMRLTNSRHPAHALVLGHQRVRGRSGGKHCRRSSIAFSINASLWIGAGCYLLLAPVSILLLRITRRCARGWRRVAVAPISVNLGADVAGKYGNLRALVSRRVGRDVGSQDETGNLG